MRNNKATNKKVKDSKSKNYKSNAHLITWQVLRLALKTASGVSICRVRCQPGKTSSGGMSEKVRFRSVHQASWDWCHCHETTTGRKKTPSWARKKTTDTKWKWEWGSRGIWWWEYRRWNLCCCGARNNDRHGKRYVVDSFMGFHLTLLWSTQGVHWNPVYTTTFGPWKMGRINGVLVLRGSLNKKLSDWAFFRPE